MRSKKPERFAILLWTIGWAGLSGGPIVAAQSSAPPSIGCSTCFPKPAGIQDAFDQAELDAIVLDGSALVVLAHDVELRHASYEQALRIEEQFPLYGSPSRSGVSKNELGSAVTARAQGEAESASLRIFAAGTPIEQRKLRNLLKKIKGTRPSHAPPLFVGQEADVQRSRSDPGALILVFHAPHVPGFRRLAVDGRHAEDEAQQGGYVLRSSVTVYRKATPEGTKAFELLLGMLDKR